MVGYGGYATHYCLADAAGSCLTSGLWGQAAAGGLPLKRPAFHSILNARQRMGSARRPTRKHRGMYKILLLDNLSDEGIDVFNQAEGFVTDVKPPQSEEELTAIISEYDGLVVRSGTKVTAKALDGAHRLKVIGRAGVGTDNIDKEAATKLGIVVMNVPGGNTISTCEHTFALLLALCRNIPAAHQSMMEGRWDRKKFQGAEVKDKVLGVIGVGRIGGEVVKRAQSFDMDVIAFDPVLSKMKADALGVELVELDELVARADFITVHAPKTAKTDNMIRKEHFEKMKPTARIVNCARGGIINEHDLAEALRENKIAGAALDVYTSEPLEDNPFLGLDNIVTTPHLAASTEEAQVVVAVEVAKQMIEYLEKGTIVNAVNVPSLDAELRAQLDPLLELASDLGLFLSQYMEGRPNALRVEYLGDIGITDTYPLTATIISGFLSPIADQPNMVNAPVLLKDLGITLNEERSPDPSDYAFEIRVSVSTDVMAYEVSGTLFGKEARIVGLDGMRLAALPEGRLVVCTNDDVPGVLANVCGVMRDANINIGNLVLARHGSKTRASVILNVDNDVPDEVLAKVEALPHIHRVQLVTL